MEKRINIHSSSTSISNELFFLLSSMPLNCRKFTYITFPRSTRVIFLFPVQCETWKKDKRITFLSAYNFFGKLSQLFIFRVEMSHAILDLVLHIFLSISVMGQFAQSINLKLVSNVSLSRVPWNLTSFHQEH